MSSHYKLHVLPGSTRSAGVMLILNLAKVDYELVFHSFESLKNEAHLKINPFGRAPSLETPEGAIFESGAIARWAARRCSSLYGQNETENTHVDMWYDWVRTTLYSKFGSFGYSMYGFDIDFIAKHDHKSFEKAIQDFVDFLKPLDHHLQGKHYLVGNSVTIADAVLIADLNSVYKFCLKKKQKDQLPNLTAYFTHLVNVPEFAAVCRRYKASDEEFNLYFKKHDKKDKKDKKQHKDEKKDEKKDKKHKEEKKEEKKEKKVEKKEEPKE